MVNQRKRICFHCHGVVPIENDAGHLRFLVWGEFSGVHCGSRTRHLLPVGNCPGSPYTAQYLEGQPRDKRGYLYFKEHEVIVRAAHKKLQDLADAMDIAKAKALQAKNHPSSNA